MKIIRSDGSRSIRIARGKRGKDHEATEIMVYRLADGSIDVTTFAHEVPTSIRLTAAKARELAEALGSAMDS